MRKFVYGLIALAWLSTMSVLVKQEIIDRRAPGPEAGYASVLTPERRDYQSRMGIYVGSRRWGTAEMLFHYFSDGSHSIDQHVELRMPPEAPSALGGVAAEIRTMINVGADFQLQSFRMTFESPLYRASAVGAAEGDVLKLTTTIGGRKEERTVDLPSSDVLSASLMPFLPVGKLKAGDRWSVVSFDPLTLTQTRATVEVVGREVIMWNGRVTHAYRLNISQPGLVTLRAWVNDRGEILRATTLFNITLEKEDIPLDEEAAE